jgi:glycosyltransferase involved in cell wall biosynthesis
MTSYNAQDSIVRALDSALAQDWPNCEIVIVDDGSKDNSVAVIEDKIRGRDNCTLVVHGHNRGFPAALNTMVNNAKGEFIAIFDDDDESREDRLSCQYRAIVDHEKENGATMTACYGSGVRVYPNGYTVPLLAIGSRPVAPSGTLVMDYQLFGEKAKGVFFGNGTPSCSLMVRKSTFDAVGPYDENLRRCEDSDFAIRLATNGGHFIGTREEVIKQYATGGHDKSPSVDYDSRVSLIEKYRGYLDDKKRYRYALGWQKMKYYHYSRRPFRAFIELVSLALKHPVWTVSHFRRSAPARIVHERKMRK